MDMKSSMALTEIMRIIDGKDAQAVKQFLAKGRLDAVGKASAFVYAARKPCLDIIKLLLESGADINSKNKDGMTALMSAGANGHLDIVKFLVEKGIDVNVHDNGGMSALRYAVANENDDAARLLKSLGAK